MATLIKCVFLACVFVLAHAAGAGAAEYVLLGLHARAQHSDTVVLARVVDPLRGVLSVERVLKDEAPTEITLVDYIDPFAGLIAEVHAFLMEMERKPSVSQHARSMLALIAKHQP